MAVSDLDEAECSLCLSQGHHTPLSIYVLGQGGKGHCYQFGRQIGSISATGNDEALRLGLDAMIFPYVAFQCSSDSTEDMPRGQRSLNILVVGAGLGGLGAGLALQSDGHHVAIVDSVTEFSEASIMMLNATSAIITLMHSLLIERVCLPHSYPLV